MPAAPLLWRAFCDDEMGRASRAHNATRRALMATTWQPTTLVQCVSTQPWLVYPGCDEPGGCHDLTLGKIYEMLGVEGQGSFYRIVDDSGEDYLYPISHFRVV
jgi:hypothetical protein